MPHPKGGYRDEDGKRIPGVTTVIGRFKESGALIRWAYGRGRDGEELYESRDKAAEAGTAARIRVMIESADQHDVWGTIGVSENIIEASWMALADAIEYKLYKDEVRQQREVASSAPAR